MIQRIRTEIVPFLQKLLKKWQSDNVAVLATSMAYYALFSIFPLLLIILSVVGLIIGSENSLLRQSLRVVGQEEMADQVTDQANAEAQIFGLINDSLSPEAATQIEDVLNRMNQKSAGAGIIGFVTLLFAASSVFAALDQAFQIIWDTKDPNAEATGIFHTARTMILKKLLAFGLVLGCAVLLLLSMLSGVVIGVVQSFIPELPGSVYLWRGVQMLVSLTLLTFAFMLLFKFLPDVHVTWKDVRLAALITAILFTIFVNISSFYIGRSDFATYGAIGSVMALLVWIFLSTQVLFLGVEFSQIYAYTYGSYQSGEYLERSNA